MTDNPVNAEYEVAQSSQLHLHPISCDVFEQTPVGDSSREKSTIFRLHFKLVLRGNAIIQTRQ